MAVDGSARRAYSACKHDSFNTWSAALERYEDTATGLKLSHVATTFAYGMECQQPNARFDGGFTLFSALAGGHALLAVTPVEFVNETSEDRRFPVGRLEIRAANDSSIVLDTDDGDATAATLALILTINGTTNTRSVQWDNWQKLLSLED